MKILALETTQAIGTVAAMDGHNLLCELGLNPNQRSAQSLAPGMATLLGQVGWVPKEVDVVAVSVGPGSFTGLRVGLTAAKVFAYAAEADILGIDTLEAIAAGAPDRVRELWVAVDAQRGQVVAGRFSRDAAGWPRPLGPATLVDLAPWLAALPPGAVVSGPVLKRVADRLPDQVRAVDADRAVPRASVVGRLAARDYAQGRRDDLWIIAPRYVRPSAAEEKWAARHSAP